MNFVASTALLPMHGDTAIIEFRLNHGSSIKG